MEKKIIATEVSMETYEALVKLAAERNLYTVRKKPNVSAILRMLIRDGLALIGDNLSLETSE